MALVDKNLSYTGGTSKLYGPEQPRPKWKDNTGDLRNLASRYADLTHFDNPLIHGLISAGIGYAGGHLLNPLVKRLYPEAGRSRFPKMTALMAGLLGGGLSWANMPKSAAYSSPISPLLMRSVTRNMVQNGMVPPAAGYAMSTAVQSAAGQNGAANVRSYSSTVNKAMQAVGTYFDPRVRLGWALAGAGAAVASKAFGVDKKFESRFGVPVGRAVQSAGPGLQLLAAGLDMIGGR